MGRGKQGNLGVLSQDCTACNGIGFTKPGYGVNVGMGYGGRPGIPGPGGYGVGPHMVPPPFGPHGYGPHVGYGPNVVYGYPHY